MLSKTKSLSLWCFLRSFKVAVGIGWVGHAFNPRAQEREVMDLLSLEPSLNIESRLARITQGDSVSPNNTKQKYLLGWHRGLVDKNVYCASMRT